MATQPITADCLIPADPLIDGELLQREFSLAAACMPPLVEIKGFEFPTLENLQHKILGLMQDVITLKETVLDYESRFTQLENAIEDFKDGR